LAFGPQFMAVLSGNWTAPNLTGISSILAKK